MVWMAFVLVVLATARFTRMVTADRIMLSLRRWVVNKYGEESMASYWVHCRWCAGFLFSAPAAAGWAVLTLPLRFWWLALPAWWAISYLIPLLARLEEAE